MCWVQHGGQGGLLFTYEDANWGVEILLEKGRLYINNFRIYGGYISGGGPITPEVLPVGKWVHVATSYNHSGGRFSLYINGHLKDSYDIGIGYQIATNTQKVRLGSKSGGDENFKGKIAEMKVYDVPLNKAQIQTSIRQGSCTFHLIVVSLPSPMVPLIIETPV